MSLKFIPMRQENRSGFYEATLSATVMNTVRIKEKKNGTDTKCNATVIHIFVLDVVPLQWKRDDLESAASSMRGRRRKSRTYLNEILKKRSRIEIQNKIPKIVNDLTTGGADKTASAETVKNTEHRKTESHHFRHGGTRAAE